MIGASKGLGFMILNAENNYNIKKLYAGAFTIAVLGIAVTKLVVLIEKHVITWKDTSAI